MLNDRGFAVVLVLTAWTISPSVSSGGAPRFIPLGYATPDAFEGQATDVSADGRVVIGQSTSKRSSDGEYLTAGFRWTADAGIKVVDGYLDPYVATFAHGLSPDGNWVVGMASNGGDGSAYRWHETQNIEILPDIPGDFELSGASAASIDSRIIVGYGVNEFGLQAGAYWEEGTVFPIDGFGANATGAATDVSADGFTIVGGRTINSGDRAFRWTQAGGLEELGVLPGAEGSVAFAISLDGGTIVGQSHLAQFVRAFCWSEDTGLVELPSMLNAESTTAIDVSGNGKIIVGSSTVENERAAVIWQDGEIHSLQEMLITVFYHGQDSGENIAWIRYYTAA